MLGWVWDNLLSSTAGWIAVASVAAVICGFVAWYIPPLRGAALAIGGAIISGAAIYVKGQRDRARAEDARKEKTIKETQKKYDQIEKRPDTIDDVKKRLKDGSF